MPVKSRDQSAVAHLGMMSYKYEDDDGPVTTGREVQSAACGDRGNCAPPIIHTYHLHCGIE